MWKYILLLCLATSPFTLTHAEVEEDEIMDSDEAQELKDAEPLDDGAPIEHEEPEQQPDDEEYAIKPSPDAKVFYTFPKQGDETNFPGGKVIKALIGFQNNGEKSFIVESVDGGFRYPMDFNYVIQNFTSFRYGREVQPGVTQTFLYMFVPSEQLAGGSRTFGLVLNLNYRDADDNLFADAPFNETVSVVEIDEGFDTEIFFMYVFLAALAALLLFGLQYLFTSVFGGRKSARKVIETGTSGSIDYDYIPKEHLKKQKSGKKNE